MAVAYHNATNTNILIYLVVATECDCRRIFTVVCSAGVPVTLRAAKMRCASYLACECQDLRCLDSRLAPHQFSSTWSRIIQSQRSKPPSHIAPQISNASSAVTIAHSWASPYPNKGPCGSIRTCHFRVVTILAERADAKSAPCRTSQLGEHRLKRPSGLDLYSRPTPK